MKMAPHEGGAVEVETKANCTATSITPLMPLQDTPPVDFNPAAYPIIALHWFMIEGVQP